jgi:hypothetical protein
VVKIYKHLLPYGFGKGCSNCTALIDIGFEEKFCILAKDYLKKDLSPTNVLKSASEFQQVVSWKTGVFDCMMNPPVV